MAENSTIEWTHHTFNPWIGCQKVGPGCDNCYAEAMMDTRYGRVDWGPHGSRSRTSAANWQKPLKWDRDAAAAGERRRVFCASLADVFDNHSSILPEWRDDLWALIAKTPNLDWMLLTKRPGNIANMLPVPFDFERQYPNVWLGCTVVNQDEAERDIPKLLRAEAKVSFLSIEPLLGPVDLTALPYGEVIGNAPTYRDALRAKLWMPEGSWSGRGSTLNGRTFVDLCRGIDLVIVGGESGPNARPMHPDWVRSLRDQCQAAGVAFFFKQWGEWAPGASRDTGPEMVPGDLYETKTVFGHTAWIAAQDEFWSPLLERFGKRAAGRLLDGRTWDQMPGVL